MNIIFIVLFYLWKSVRICGRWRIISFLYCGEENLKIQPGPWGTERVPKPESWEVSSLTLYSPVCFFHTTYPNKAKPTKQQNKIWIQWHANTPKAKTSFLKPPIIFTGEYQHGKVTHVHKNAQSKTVSSGLRDLHLLTHALLKHNMTMRFIPKVGVFHSSDPLLCLFSSHLKLSFPVLNVRSDVGTRIFQMTLVAPRSFWGASVPNVHYSAAAKGNRLIGTHVICIKLPN